MPPKLDRRGQFAAFLERLTDGRCNSAIRPSLSPSKPNILPD
jgi:hypothetical protein